MKTANIHNAVLLPGEASTLLFVLAVMFATSGALVLLAVATVLVGKAAGLSFVQDLDVPLLRSLLGMLYGAGYCWIGVQLHAARRRGAYVALVLSGLQLASVALSSSVTIGRMAVPALTVIALALAWPHLSAGGRDPARHGSIAPRASAPRD